jgi:hypothetical protein
MSTCPTTPIFGGMFQIRESCDLEQKFILKFYTFKEMGMAYSIGRRGMYIASGVSRVRAMGATGRGLLVRLGINILELILFY